MKEIIIVGGVGNTARRNRDDGRVLSGGGVMYTLKSHIDKDHPLILKKHDTNNRQDGQHKGQHT